MSWSLDFIAGGEIGYYHWYHGGLVRGLSPDHEEDSGGGGGGVEMLREIRSFLSNQEAAEKHTCTLTWRSQPPSGR